MKNSYGSSIAIQSVFGAAAIGLCLAVAGCSSSSDGSGSSNGGSSGNGNGGSHSSGGSSSNSSGGSGSGGSHSSGGSSSNSSGGSSSNSSGGSGSGGSSDSSSGGSSSSSSGGSGSGGSGAGGSASGSGGAATGSGTTVTFSSGKAAGAMVGYGWVSLGSSDTLTDPLCGTDQITSKTSCAATTWSTTDSLCMSGSIPALDKTTPDYTGNWGVELGVNATEPNTSLGQSFSTVAITVSGSPTSGLRAMLHRKGDSVDTNYCLAMTSGTAMTLTTFNTKCYDATPDGDALSASDVPNIDKVAVQVSSSTTAISVEKLCITGITFGK